MRDPHGRSYDILHGGVRPAARCQVRGCSQGECRIRLRVGSAAVCAGHLWECQVGVRAAAALSAGICAGFLAPVAAVETWLLSSGHWVCSVCVETEGRTLPSPLEDPVSTCLSCSRALHRLDKPGLDGQACCEGCHSALPAGGTLLEDMTTRLVLVWLDIYHSLWPARFLAAGHNFSRSVVRLLAGACVSALPQQSRHACGSRSSASGVTPGRSKFRGSHATVAPRQRGPRAPPHRLWGKGTRITRGWHNFELQYNDFASVDACPLPRPAPP